ncbi:hypothetical protein JCM11641_000627 [Rhodosporidiobolus odoratus]
MAHLVGVPPPAPPLDPTLPPPLAIVRTFRPYYAPLELDHLVHLQATTRVTLDHQGQPLQASGNAAPVGSTTRKPMSEHRINQHRQLAAGFIERVAARLGFPRRTTATAQKLYHRFHLHFPISDFAYQDVSLSALLVASKLEDTLKKLRDIQIAAYQVLSMMEGGDGRGEGDLATQEAHRPHLIGIERLILQTISFNFNLHRSLSPSASSAAQVSNDAFLGLATPPPTRDAFTHLLRLSAALPSLPVPLVPTAANTTAAAHEPIRKTLTYLAFLLLADLHRNLAPLSYPPHTCAVATLWVAGFLLVEGARVPGDKAEQKVWDEDVPGWCEEEGEGDMQDIDDIAQTLLNLLISLCPSPSSTTISTTTTSQISPLFSPSSASPSEPSSSSLPTSSSSAAPAAARALGERERHLLQAGVPNAFNHPSAVPSSSASSSAAGTTATAAAGGGGGGGGGGGWMSTDRLTAVKIALRTARPSSSPFSFSSTVSASKRPRPDSNVPTDEAGPDGLDWQDLAADALESESELKKARRWHSLEVGLAEVGRLRDERDERDRVRREEREEREREKVALEMEFEGLEAVEAGRNLAGSRGKTEEEREKERRERRERGKPVGVRYRF